MSSLQIETSPSAPWPKKGRATVSQCHNQTAAQKRLACSGEGALRSSPCPDFHQTNRHPPASSSTCAYLSLLCFRPSRISVRRLFPPANQHCREPRVQGPLRPLYPPRGGLRRSRTSGGTSDLTQATVEICARGPWMCSRSEGLSRIHA